MMGLLPILLLIFITILILSRSKKRPTRRLVGFKMRYMIFAAYLVILVIAALTVDFATAKLHKKYPTVESSDYQEESATMEMIDLLSEDRLLKTETHTAEGGSLEIVTEDPGWSTLLFIERKNVNDNAIEEKIYGPSLLINKFDVSKELDYVLPDWKDGQLLLRPQPYQELEFASYNNSYLLQQFTGGVRNFSPSHIDQNFLGIYLTIPKDLHIIADEENVFIEYVNERSNLFEEANEIPVR